jgi:uncharacterized phage protein (TIGR01671 family)
MREIKFRGKRLDSGEWVYGDRASINGMYIFPHDGFDSPDTYEVDPGTVGQYIGRKDCNGVEIYEDDALHGMGVVVYVPAEARFGIVYDGELDEIIFAELEQHELKVIGNIHDNPEIYDNPELPEGDD